MEMIDFEKLIAESLEAAQHLYLSARSWNPGWRVDMQTRRLRGWALDHLWCKATGGRDWTAPPEIFPADAVIARLRELGVGEGHILIIQRKKRLV